MAQSPTSRSLDFCKKNSMSAGITERFNSFTKRRHDLFGFIDMIVLSEGKTLGVQVTSRSNMSARAKKIKTECKDDALAWLNAGNEIEVWGWGKIKKGKRHLWDLRRVKVQKEDITEYNTNK